MDSQTATNIISIVIASITLGAVLVAIKAISENRKQAKDNWAHSQQQATEERKHQIRPIMAPEREIFNNSMMETDPNTSKKVERKFYTSEQRIGKKSNNCRP
jgi:Flp pilus assembly protein TadB